MGGELPRAYLTNRLWLWYILVVLTTWFPVIATVLRLILAAIVAILRSSLGAHWLGWLYGPLLIANLALDVAGAYVARRAGASPGRTGAREGGAVGTGVDLLAAKLVYGLLLLLVAGEARAPAWLALSMIGRDVALLLGALWVWVRTRQFPYPTGHERWPTQVFYLALALYLVGAPWMEPVTLLLFGLVLTRLPGFWFRLCDALDPTAYLPQAMEEPRSAAAWRQAIRSVASRLSSRLTLALLPAAMLAVAVLAVWLVTAAPRLFPGGVNGQFGEMAALMGRVEGCTGWEATNALMAYFCLLPMFLLLPDLITLHLREVTAALGSSPPTLLRRGVLLVATSTAITALCLLFYVVAGNLLFGPGLECLLWSYAGLALFPVVAFLLSIVGLSYPGRFQEHPPLYRLQLAGASLSTPFIALLLGQLAGLFSPLQGVVAISVMLLFAGVVTQRDRIVALMQALGRPGRDRL